MKVRIRRAYSKDVWYANKIGEEFEVEIVNNFTYSTEIMGAKRHIDMFDCEVIPYEPVLIAEQPKEEPDPRLFQAAVAAMQGLLIGNDLPPNSDTVAYAWTLAETFINEGKKRGHL